MQFSRRNDEYQVRRKKSRKKLCIASYCYSITKDKYWWFWENSSFSSVFNLFHIITSLPLLEERGQREREETIYPT